MKKNKIRLGISLGDINGVGAEVILKTFSDTRVLELVTPIIYGSTKTISQHKKALEIDVQYNRIQSADEALNKKLNIVAVWKEEVQVVFGEKSATGGSYALKSLEAATQDLAAGKIDGLVTAPIDKKSIQSDNFDFPGHTEYLTKMSNATSSLMFMVSGGLRVGVVTGHIPLQEVAKNLKKEEIVQKAIMMNDSLQKDFGIRKPRIAILGLNPHAGEKGMLGTEEEEVISPAISQLLGEGYLAFGPYAADGFFGSSNYKNFDGILAMYHDQGLIPFKALSFGSGVNYTAGLPIVRTSPDHGTAFDIAGKGLADPSSFRAAIYLAKDIISNRLLWKEINASPLKLQEKKARTKKEE
jgi:4-hydroxythreonine-4-phosphate dehydrogenase